VGVRCDMLIGHAATCQQCRTAKVKCDMELPCGRCVRLGKACTPTGPSRRGKKRKEPAAAAASRAAEGVEPDDDAASRLRDVCVEMVDGTKVAGSPLLEGLHPGLFLMALEWIGIALRKRSTKLLAKAFDLCSKANLPLDKVLGGREGAHLNALFMPGEHPVVLAPRPRLPELLPACVLDRLSGGSGLGDDATILVRCGKDGMLCFVASPLFEETIATAAQLEQAYLENKHDALHSVFGDGHSIIMSQAGAMFFSVKSLPMLEPRSVTFPQMKVRMRDGRFASSELRVWLWLGATVDGDLSAPTTLVVFEFIASTSVAAATVPATVAATVATASSIALPVGVFTLEAGGDASNTDSAVEWEPPSLALYGDDKDVENSWLGDTAAVDSLDPSMLPRMSDSQLRELCKTVMGGNSPR
jgi:hypothetical protein